MMMWEMLAGVRPWQDVAAPVLVASVRLAVRLAV
jgi:hypothetical protein